MRNPTSNPDSASPMAVTPIPKLLRSLGIPLICSLVIQACYNIVDSYFVAKLSEEAMTALALVYPVQNLITSIAVGFGWDL